MTSLSQWIARGDLSSRRLTEIYLVRIESPAGMLECFVTVTPELARAQADAAEALLGAGTRLGPLHGDPLRAQGSVRYEGHPNHLGRRPLRGPHA